MQIRWKALATVAVLTGSAALLDGCYYYDPYYPAGYYAPPAPTYYYGRPYPRYPYRRYY